MENEMEMKNIFKSISDTITETENEKEAAKDIANRKYVDKALEGVKDLKEIIRYIMGNFESKEKIQEMIKKSILKVYRNEEQQHMLTLKDQPWGTTKYSPLFENNFVDSIYKRNNLKQIVLALSDNETQHMLIDELHGNFIKNTNRVFNLKIDGYWFQIFIKDGILNDTIGQINFSISHSGRQQYLPLVLHGFEKVL